jgi:hypothetical protein
LLSFNIAVSPAPETVEDLSSPPPPPPEIRPETATSSIGMYTNLFSSTIFKLSTHRLAFFQYSAPPSEPKKHSSSKRSKSGHSSSEKSKSGEKKKKRKNDKREKETKSPEIPSSATGMYRNTEFSLTMFKLSTHRLPFFQYHSISGG